MTTNFELLVKPIYIEFFCNPDSNFELIEKDNWFVYPEIMQQFKKDLDKCKGHFPARTWTNMRNKYFGGKAYVYPDQMIKKIDDFDERECVAFIFYCAMYKERYFTGAFAEYSREGYIGKILKKLQVLLPNSRLNENHEEYYKQLLEDSYKNDSDKQEFIESLVNDGEEYEYIYELLNDMAERYRANTSRKRSK